MVWRRCKFLTWPSDSYRMAGWTRSWREEVRIGYDSKYANPITRGQVREQRHISRQYNERRFSLEAGAWEQRQIRNDRESQSPQLVNLSHTGQEKKKRQQNPEQLPPSKTLKLYTLFFHIQSHTESTGSRGKKRRKMETLVQWENSLAIKLKFELIQFKYCLKLSETKHLKETKF